MTSDEIYKRIIVMDSMKVAKTFMNSKDITKSDLTKLCKKYDVFIETKSTKEVMINRFLSCTVGVKLKKKAINKYHRK
ncbi:MAG: hypothetical protein ACERKV_13010 [Clostridiaceae bacterium]